ncbi:Sir2 family NAD-dependent protein deacetylase [Cellulomonas marina]|uniref:Sir2 family NAD-dependent protein deacetylase n=1 Tax=Cellulomonas marina TaxID=988821 RepID=UPI003570D381
MRTSAGRPVPDVPSPVAGTFDDVVEVLTGRRTAVLTGAGVSTDSGIPDYRGPGSPPRNPMTFQDFVGDPAYRRHYWARNHVGWQHVGRKAPNAGHRALARLEARGVVTGIVTQNVDTLHEVAGSRRVIDLHGRYDQVLCLRCGTRYARSEVAERLEALNPGFAARVAPSDPEIAPDADAVIEQTEGFRVQDCWAPDPDGGPGPCGGMLKPDIVYFGETVPRPRVDAAYALVDASDALLVAGSSLAVQSGLRFVRHAVAGGLPVVVVNRGATRGDALATVTLHAGTSETLAGLDAVLPTPT